MGKNVPRKNVLDNILKKSNRKFNNNKNLISSSTLYLRLSPFLLFRYNRSLKSKTLRQISITNKYLRNFYKRVFSTVHCLINRLPPNFLENFNGPTVMMEYHEYFEETSTGKYNLLVFYKKKIICLLLCTKSPIIKKKNLF